MTPRTLRIATRKSRLALWQAEHVRSKLEKTHQALTVELVPLSTQGDKIIDVPLAKIGGKGLFVKELETAILEQRADIAVHSIKDVPMELPRGLELSVVLERAAPTDAFVSNRFASLASLPAGAHIGTSSLRRRSQLRAFRRDFAVTELRGNVNTRLQRLDDGNFDAIILATAGLQRLGMADRVCEELQLQICLPAVGQGAIGIETRTGDTEVLSLIGILHDQRTASCISAERAFNRHLQGGCQVPIAGFANFLGTDSDKLSLRGLVASEDGAEILGDHITGDADKAEELGINLAETLLSKGAGRLLQSLWDRQ